ncbi:MAG TPA: hypothetical protein VG733_05950 [Chthoniobacteraceae bacterium]|nr:hypothetical protein [Chthoniobacteraceae bacterium]
MIPPRFISSILIALALTTGCGKLAAQAPAPAMPAKFQVDIDAIAGTGFTVALEGDHLVYTTFKSGKRLNKVRKVQPTAEQWQTFWNEMNAIDIWHWSAKYAPSAAVEGGTQWDATIEGGGHSIKSEGGNAYPSDEDPAKSGPDKQFTKRYIKFYNAVLHLVGETSSD